MQIDNLVDKLITQSKKPNSTFPLDVFPIEIRDIINHYVETFKFPIDYFAASILAASATAIGRSCTLRAGSYMATANLYLAIVGNPGINKSSPVIEAYAPINTRQSQVFNEYKSSHSEWKITPEMRDNTPEPLFKKTFINDGTMEALIKALQNNTRGVTIVRDELSGWFKSLNQYRSGGDMEDYLSMWQGNSITKTRVSSGDTYVPNTLLTIIGTIQPRVLDELSEGKEENGFLDRFLYVAPENIIKPYPSLIMLDPNIANKYAMIINALLDIPMFHESDTKELSYSSESIEIVNNWVCKSVDKQNQTEDDVEQSVRAKFDIYIHRFALILQALKYAVSGQIEDLQVISIESAIGAVKLADYFYSMAEKIRLKPKSDMLIDKWKQLFDTLPIDGGEFTTAEFKERAKFIEIPEASASRWLAKQSKKGGVITKIRHGVYAAIN